MGHRFRRSTVYLLLFVSSLAGLGLARTGPGPGVLFCGASVVFLLPVLRKRSFLTILLVVLTGVSCGWWRGAIYMQKLVEYEPLYYQKITLVMQASEDATYGKTKQLTFESARFGWIMADN